MLQHLFFSHHKLKLNATAFDLMATAFFTMQKNATVFFLLVAPRLVAMQHFGTTFATLPPLESNTAAFNQCPRHLI